jgi:hypothetical protein
MSRYRAGYGSYRLRNRYHGLEDTLRYQQFFGYTEERFVPYPV